MLGGGHPRSRAPTATPKHPVPVLAHASIQSMMMMMMSESPGSAPRPSCKHDSNSSQPKALTRVSRTRSLAPRHSPTGLLHGLCTMFSNTAKPTGVSVVTGLQMQLASHFHKQFSTEINIVTGMTFQHKVFPKKLSKSLQVMHLPSQRHALDQLPQQPPPSKVFPARRGTSFLAADINPHLSPLQSQTERMNLAFCFLHISR